MSFDVMSMRLHLRGVRLRWSVHCIRARSAAASWREPIASPRKRRWQHPPLPKGDKYVFTANIKTVSR